MIIWVLPSWILGGRKKSTSKKKKTSVIENTKPHLSDSSDVSYTDIFKDLFTKDASYNEQRPNEKGI